MNKVVKGTLAATVGVALLGGGAGSLAFWQVSSGTQPLTLSTGYVEFRPGLASYTLNGESITLDQLELQYLVPGDTVTYEQQFVYDLRGTDAVLRVSDLTFGSTSSVVVDAFETSVSVTGVDLNAFVWNFSPTIDANAYNVSGYGGAAVVTTISLPEGLEDDGAMFSMLNVEGLGVTVTQVAEPLAEPEV